MAVASWWGPAVRVLRVDDDNERDERGNARIFVAPESCSREVHAEAGSRTSAGEKETEGGRPDAEGHTMKKKSDQGSGGAMSTHDKGQQHCWTAGDSERTETLSERFPWLRPGARRDASGRSEGHPSYDPSTVHIPDSALSTMTPFERQVRWYLSCATGVHTYGIFHPRQVSSRG